GGARAEGGAGNEQVRADSRERLWPGGGPAAFPRVRLRLSHRQTGGFFGAGADTGYNLPRGSACLPDRRAFGESLSGAGPAPSPREEVAPALSPSAIRHRQHGSSKTGYFSRSARSRGQSR